MARRTRKASTPGYLTLSEAAKYLHVSESTLRTMVRCGRFPRPIRHAGAGDPVWERRAVVAYAVLSPLLPDLFRLPPKEQRQSKRPEK